MTYLEKLKSKNEPTFSIPSQSSGFVENNGETRGTNNLALSGSDKVINAQLKLNHMLIELVTISMKRLNKQEAKIKSQEVLQEEVSKNVKLSQQELQKQNAKITEHEKKFEIQEKSLVEQSKGNLELFGIFASIFTFISVEIKILESAQGIYQLLGLTLILTGAILLMISLIFISSKILILDEAINKSKKRLFIFVFTFATICLIGGVFFTSFGNENITINVTYSNQKEIDQLKDEMKNLEERINNKKDQP